MNNEIKEINKNMQYIIIGNTKYYGIAPELLNYITNLQEKYDEALTDLVHESYKRIGLENKITNLQEEINRLTAESTEWESKCYDLQEENEKIKIEKQEEYNRFNLMSKFRDKALVRELMYKSRIDKVIEYIEHVKAFNEEDRDTTMKWEYDVFFPKLKNVLQGSDEE